MVFIVGSAHLLVLFGILNPFADPPLPADSSDRRRFTGASIVKLDYLKLNNLLETVHILVLGRFSAKSGFGCRIAQGRVENVKTSLTITNDTSQQLLPRSILDQTKIKLIRPSTQNEIYAER